VELDGDEGLGQLGVVLPDGEIGDAGWLLTRFGDDVVLDVLGHQVAGVAGLSEDAPAGTRRNLDGDDGGGGQRGLELGHIFLHLYFNLVDSFKPSSGLGFRTTLFCRLTVLFDGRQLYILLFLFFLLFFIFGA